MPLKNQISAKIPISIDTRINKNRQVDHRMTIIDNNSSSIQVRIMTSLLDENGDIINGEGITPYEGVINIDNNIIVDVDGNIIGKATDFDIIPDGAQGYFDYISALVNTSIANNVKNNLF